MKKLVIILPFIILGCDIPSGQSTSCYGSNFITKITGSLFVNDIIDGDEIIADLSVKYGPEVDLKVGPQVLKLEDISKNYNDIEVEFISLDFDELDEIEEKKITGLDSL